ncbi:MAG: hypothetical protein EP330_04810 [Deltaproteobacteria bacterium]|nr:MAG: hypothetical protein EP330_04810 [Deltaproteobacteria bacterium]
MPLLAPPASELSWRGTYRTSPRAKRAFRTPLDANKLIDASGQSEVVVESSASSMQIRQVHPLLRGRIEETLDLDIVAAGLRSARLLRVVHTDDDAVVRREEVDFRAGTIPLPEDVYPEVMTPFLLVHQDWSSRQTLYTWMNDRFIARVHAEGKRGTVQVDGRSRAALAVQMYPDFNDWVPLGGMLTKLTKPFLPRYYMWFDPDRRDVLRFEGPYGPPGAPEIVLELES